MRGSELQRMYTSAKCFFLRLFEEDFLKLAFFWSTMGRG